MCDIAASIGIGTFQAFHAGFSEEQIRDLKEIEEKVSVIYGMVIHMLHNNDYSKIDDYIKNNCAYDCRYFIIKRVVEKD